MFLSTRFARRVGFLLGAAGFVTALAGAAGSPANADNGLPTPDANVIYRLTTPNSLGLAVANDSMADDAPVVQNALDVFALSQDWSFLPQAGGSYEMINLNSGKCLSVYGNSTAPGTGLVQYACHGWADQQWKLMRGANGDIQSWVSVSSGLAMDVPGSSPRQGLQLQQWPYNGNDRLASQHFDVKVVAHTIDQTKTYRITTANSLAFDVTNSSQNNDAPVIQWGVNGGQNQNWLVRQVPGSRYFQIINLNSAKCLTISNNSTSAGAGLVQYDCYGQPNQLWDVSPIALASVVIRSPYSGQSVDVPGDTPAWGTQLQQYPYHAGPGQVFTLTAV